MPLLHEPGRATIHYADVDFGFSWDDRGDPVVLLPGLGCTFWVWRPVLAHLAAQRRLVLVDPRGAGLSAPDGAAAPSWSTADMADDVRRMLDHLGIARADVVGLSMGGTVALALALDHPERVGRLVTIGSFGGLPPEAKPSTDAELERVAAETMAETAARRIGVAFTDDVDPRLKAWVVEMVSRTDKAAYEAQLRVTTEFDVLDRLDEVKATTTVIVGTADRTVPAAVSQLVSDGVPGAVFAPLEGHGHFVHLEATEAFVPVLDEALAR